MGSATNRPAPCGAVQGGPAIVLVTVCAFVVLVILLGILVLARKLAQKIMQKIANDPALSRCQP